jgi:hypothetical protein
MKVNPNLALATVRATNDWRYKLLANIFLISLVLFVISLFKKDWSQLRWFLLGIFAVSGILIKVLITHLGKVKDVDEKEQTGNN